MLNHNPIASLLSVLSLVGSGEAATAKEKREKKEEKKKNGSDDGIMTQEIKEEREWALKWAEEEEEATVKEKDAPENCPFHFLSARCTRCPKKMGPPPPPPSISSFASGGLGRHKGLC